MGKRARIKEGGREGEDDGMKSKREKGKVTPL